MHGWYDVAQGILQILSNPAWGGIGVIISSILSLMAIFLARRPKAQEPPSSTHAKEMTLTTSNLFYRGSFVRSSKINRHQEPQDLDNSASASSYFIRDGYHRLTLAKELVKDVDIMVVLNA